MEPTVNAGMSISDWSGLVAMVVSICALISPILTAICNNWHQRKMKQMEYDHQEREDRLKREREIYEGYIRAAGAAVQSETLDNLSDLALIQHWQCIMHQKSFEKICCHWNAW